MGDVSPIARSAPVPCPPHPRQCSTCPFLHPGTGDMASSRLQLALLLLFFLLAGRAAASEEVTRLARAFVAGHEKRIRPLDVAAGEAWWVANTTGDKAAFKKKVEAQNK